MLKFVCGEAAEGFKSSVEHELFNGVRVILVGVEGFYSMVEGEGEMIESCAEAFAPWFVMCAERVGVSCNETNADDGASVADMLLLVSGLEPSS